MQDMKQNQEREKGFPTIHSRASTRDLSEPHDHSSVPRGSGHRYTYETLTSLWSIHRHLREGLLEKTVVALIAVSVPMVSNLSVHRLSFLAMMLSAKFHDDVSYSNNYYAKVGGLSIKEVQKSQIESVHLLSEHLAPTIQDDVARPRALLIYFIMPCTFCQAWALARTSQRIATTLQLFKNHFDVHL